MGNRTMYRNREGDNPFHKRTPKGPEMEARTREVDALIAELEAKHGIPKGGTYGLRRVHRTR